MIFLEVGDGVYCDYDYNNDDDDHDDYDDDDDNDDDDYDNDDDNDDDDHDVKTFLSTLASGPKPSCPTAAFSPLTI